MSDDHEQTEEELAAAWGAETEAEVRRRRAGRSSPRASSTRTRSTACWASTTAAGGENRTGIRAIINSALVSYERLPMLEIVFDRLVRMMTTTLRNFTSDNVEVSLDNILSIRFGDYLNSIPLPAILAVFRAEELDNYGLLTVDSALIYSIVDVLLGGRRGTAAMRIEGRPYTTIERTLVERMVEVVLADLPASFEPLCPVTFRSTAWRPTRASPPSPAGQRRHPGEAAHRHGRPRRAHRAAAALRHAGADPRDAAAAVHGREVRPRQHLGKPPGRRAVDHRAWKSPRCWTNRRCGCPTSWRCGPATASC